MAKAKAGRCDFYRCFDQRFPCHQHNYALAYGWNFCIKFDHFYGHLDGTVSSIYTRMAGPSVLNFKFEDISIGRCTLFCSGQTVVECHSQMQHDCNARDLQVANHSVWGCRERNVGPSRQMRGWERSVQPYYDGPKQPRLCKCLWYRVSFSGRTTTSLIPQCLSALSSK